MLDRALQAELAAILPPDALLLTPEETKPYECDGLTLFRAQPAAVALPETEAQVVSILKACHAARVPVVARGAGTSLSGGALPDPSGIVLSLAKFKRILTVDPVARIAVVQPGVRNLAISEAAAQLGLYYAPDPSSQIACSIGGNVAENAGGVHCLKYGLTVHNVRRVRGVLVTGDVVEFGGESLDSPGYDLLALVNGSEGLLAVITEITVKLLPKPQLAQVALACVRRHRESRRSRRRDHRRRHHSRRPRDDGPARHACGRAVRACQLPARSGSRPARRIGRHQRGSRGRDGGHPSPLDGVGRERSARVARRSATALALVRTQGRVPCGRAHLARLLLHGWHDPAQGASARAESDCRVVEGIRPRVRERLPCGATATCIRSSCTTRIAKARLPGPSRSATASSSSASRSAAR
jgi:FAD/FMN-containing dehydrogenase